MLNVILRRFCPWSFCYVFVYENPNSWGNLEPLSEVQRIVNVHEFALELFSVHCFCFFLRFIIEMCSGILGLRVVAQVIC